MEQGIVMIDGARVLAVIPARGGSKGLPGKNLALVDGQSLIERAVRSSQASLAVDRVVVSTDDMAIADEAVRWGAEVPFMRASHLAGDETSMADVVTDVLQRIDDGDWVVLLQPTSPLRTGSDIDSVIGAAIGANADSAVSLRQAKAHPAWLWTLTEDQRVRPLIPGDQPTRRQDLERVYERSGAVFAFTRKWFLQHRRFSDDDTIGFAIPDERSIDVDTLLDLVVANAVASASTEPS
jgi:CMP-N,N'-diacetyllegionaminic acid synthase